MSPVAELFDGTELEFPDGTAPEIIQQTAKRLTLERTSTTPGKGISRYNSLLGGENAQIKSAPGFIENLVGAVTAPFHQERAPIAPDQPRPTTLQRGVETAGAVGKGILDLLNVPFNTVAPTVTKYAGENLPIEPRTAEAIGNAAGAVTQGSILPWRSRAPLAPARTIDDLITAPRPGLPAPPEQLRLPPAVQPRLNPPADMVTQVTPEGVASQAPKRTIIDLVDEVKKDVKAQVIDEIFAELKSGRPQAAAAAPKKAAPLSIEDLRGQLAPEARPVETAASPIFEQTEAGKQAVIPGAEARTIPAGPLRSKRVQTQAPLDLEQPALRAQEPELPTAPPRQQGNWEGPAYRAESGYTHDKGQTAADVVNYEQQTLGNQLGVTDKVLAELKNRPANDVVWVTKTKTAARRYGPESLHELPEGSRVLAEDGDGGFLVLKGRAPESKAPPQPRAKLEDFEVAVSTFIKRQGGMKIPKNLKEEFGGWNRLHNPKGLGVDVMADEAFNAGLLPEPTTAALIDSLKSGRKTARVAGEAQQVKQSVDAELERHIKGLQEEPAGVEYKGHDYTAVVPEKGGIRLKDEPDKVLKKPDEIFKVEGKVPFDVEAAAAEEKAAVEQAGISARLRAQREGEAERSFEALYRNLIRADRGNVDSLTRDVSPEMARKVLDRLFHAPGDNPVLRSALKAKIAEAGPQAQPRSIGDLLKGQKGQVGSTETNPIVTGSRLAMGEAIEQSGKTVRKTMGPEGNDLIDRLTSVRNDAERNTGMLSQPMEAAIKKLKREEYENFVDVLEGKAQPVSQEVANAVGIADKVRKNIAQRAEAVDLQIKNPLTGEYSPFRPRENYFPHYGKEEFSKIVENPTRRAEIKAQIKEQLGPNTTDKQAEDALRAMVKATRNRDAHLEISRVLDTGDYHKDPRVFLKYINDANRRIAIASQFGPKLEKGEELITAIGQKHGDKAESFSRTLFNRELRQEEVPDTMAHRMMQGARNYEVLTKLGRAFIPNMSQHAYTAIVTNAKDTAKGIAKSFTKEGKDFARRAGVVNDEILKEFYNEVTGASAGDSLIHKAINIELKPFTWSEKLNRTAAAIAGRYNANETFEALQKSPGKTKLRDSLSKMGVDVDAALERGSLSNVDELKAAQNIVNRTQFKVDPMELPLFWSSPEGKLLTQFKSFNFKSGQFMKDEILKEVAKGNVGPLIRAIAVLPPAAVAVKTVQNALKPESAKQDKEGIADYLASVGVLGIFSDLVRNGGRMDVSTIAGPTLSDVGRGLEAVAQTKQRLSSDYTGNEPAFGPLAKFAARQVPVVGSNLAAMFNKDKSERQKMLDELGLGDMEREKNSSRKKLLKELGLNRGQ